MTILEALILGLVQGITEFLPVSSSGHTILIGKLLSLNQIPMEFELTVHLGTLLAVCLALRERLFSLIKKPFSKPTALIIVATIPTVIIFFVFKSFFEQSFDGHLLVYCFLITAALIIISDFIASNPKALSNVNKQIDFFDAIIIGISQGVAALPGISRSGATVCSSMLLKNSKEESLNFSFLLSIPIIIGSALFEFIENDFSVGMPFHLLFVGFLAAFLSGLLGVSFIKLLLKNHSLNGFALYLFLLSVFLIINDSFLLLF